MGFRAAVAIARLRDTDQMVRRGFDRGFYVAGQGIRRVPVSRYVWTRDHDSKVVFSKPSAKIVITFHLPRELHASQTLSLKLAGSICAVGAQQPRGVPGKESPEKGHSFSNLSTPFPYCTPPLKLKPKQSS